MNLMSYVDNLLAFNNQQIKYFKENINKNPKTISNENINKIIDNIKEEEIILKEIEAEYDNQFSNIIITIFQMILIIILVLLKLYKL